VNLEALLSAVELRAILIVVVLAVFAVLLLGPVVFQQWYAFQHRRRSRPPGPPWKPGQAGRVRWPSVDVIVPCYNENPALLERCCRSIARQDYPGRLRVWLIDDGSSNREALQEVYRRYQKHHRWTVVRQPGNSGKRLAQDRGFSGGNGDLVATVDSDTEIDPDGIKMLAAAFRDPRVGAVTGDVRALNAGATWLTRLIAVRYRLLFEQERAAQSWKGSVLCCSGPFSIYRRSALRRVWGEYVTHRLWGRQCTFGDDLHLTLLVLGKGYQSLYEPRARARTEVPTTLRGFARQQLRWNKSFYRYLPLMWRVLRGRGWFLKVDVAVRLALPLTLAVALPWVVTQLALGTSLGEQPLLPFFVAAGLAQLASAAAQARDLRFLLLYGFVFFAVLIPARIGALCTIGNNGWGTRGKATEPRRVRATGTKPLVAT